MSRYRFSCTIDDASLNSVIIAAAAAGLKLGFDPEISLKQLAEKTEPEKPRAEPKPHARRTIKRVHHNGANWPAENSIYDVVLKAIQTGPHTALQLRSVLQAGGFSPQSVNSSLVRLEKAQKVKKSPEGWVAA